MGINPLGESSTITRDPAPWTGAPAEGDDAEVVNVNRYQRFADIYDVFGSEDFCLALTSHILDALECYRLPVGAQVVDVACGTGVITVELARAGYDMIGIDLSEHMLGHARQRADKAGMDIAFHRMDMRTFRLQERVPCITCTHDSLDHLFEDEELDLAFEHCITALRPGGLFLFDMNRWSGIRHLNGRTVFVETDDKSGAYHLIAEDQTLETNIVGFIQVQGNLYERFDETLYQRCYSDEEIEQRLEMFGMEVLDKKAIQHLNGDVFKQLWVARKPALDIPELF